MKKLLVFLTICFSSLALFAANPDLHYVINETGVQGTYTTITGVLTIDGVEAYNGPTGETSGGGLLEIGVFDQDGECRAAKFPSWRAKSNQWIYQLQIRGNNGFTYPTFKIYDHNTETEWNYVIDFSETITWTSGGKYGSLNAPFAINFIPAGVTVSRNISGYGDATNGKYYLIASPIDDLDPTAVTSMTEGEFDLYTFSDAVNQEEWQNYEAGAFTLLQPGKGYLYAHKTDITPLSFTGAASSVTQTTLQKTDGANLAGWNLVGNPYDVNAYIAKEFYRMNSEGTELVAPLSDENFILPMEGVFVLADNNGETLAFSKTPVTKGPSLAINVSKDNALVDRAVVAFGQERTLPKFQINPNHSKVYFQKDNSDFAVVSAEDHGEMPVSFKAEANGSYTIAFNTKDVDFEYLHLIDNLNGNDVDLLASPSYSFEATTSDYASRFRLVFATGNDGLNQFAFVSNGDIVLNGVNGNTSVLLFDVNGRLLSSSIGTSRISTENMAAGVYMVQLVNGDNTLTQKIVVK